MSDHSVPWGRGRRRVAISGTDYGGFGVSFEKKLANVRAEVAFVGVGGQLLITERLGRFEQAERPSLTENPNQPGLARVEGSPDLLQRRLTDVAQDDATARAAKDVAVRVDVNAFGAEETSQAVHAAKGLNRSRRGQSRQMFRRPAGEAKGIGAIGLDIDSIPLAQSEI